MIDMGKESDAKMRYLDFIQGTVLAMEQTSFEYLKNALINKYITLSVISPEKIDQMTLAEKMCDFFEKAEIQHKKTFDKFVEVYFGNLDSIVAGRVAKPPQQRKKDETALPVPRARRYYEKAQSLRKGKLNLVSMVDYSRIMMCLYAAIIEDNGTEITNFNYAATSLNVDEIINAMQNEESSYFNVTKKKRFDTTDPYGSDAITFVIAITILYKILDYSLEGGNEDG